MLASVGCSGAPDEGSSAEGSEARERRDREHRGERRRRHEYSAHRAFLPCAADGAGEFVLLQGALEGVVHTTIDGTGRYHIGVQLRPASVSGSGEITGDVYRLTGATHNEFSGSAAAQLTFNNEYRIVAPGPNNSAITSFTAVCTVGADGALSVNNNTETGAGCL
jgi:hypothetical protein